jgi:sugar O-acyltransferase (sialic acid O-acetyltransferase NeuD family)
MPSHRLVIVGAGDFGREVLWAANEISKRRRTWTALAFLDDRPEAAAALQQLGITVPVLGTTHDYVPKPRDRLLCAIGDPTAKLAVCERLVARGAQFTNLVHPSAVIGARSTVGIGVILCRLVTITVDVTIGNFVTINLHSSVAHNAVIEDGCTLSDHCDVTGHARLGRGVFLGSHGSVLPHVEIGAFATVGAGSVAFRTVNPGETVMGVPARLFRVPNADP